MKRIMTSDPNNLAQLDRLLAQRTSDSVIESTRTIVDAVRQRGDAALLEFSSRFDRVALKADELRVSPEEIAKASVDPSIEAALEKAMDRIAAFHRRERRNDWWTVSADGALLGQRYLPIRSAGIYVPGGGAPYPSSLLMNAVPAKLAGVSRIVLATPPGAKGRIDPTILVAAQLCGIEEVYRVGGAQAVAALAYGTESIAHVDKIVGPGNAYVAEAKRLVYGAAGIDTIAGPSEVAILADETADPRFVAADLIAQAEHDSDAFVAVVTTAASSIPEILAQIEEQTVGLERREMILSALERSVAILARSLQEAIEWIERISPEHLELLVSDPLTTAAEIRSAGVILCGPFAPAAVCDYGIGPNHVLPTGGSARFASALGVDDFLRRVSLVYPNADAFSSVAPDGITLATAEGLTAHAAALRIRSEVDNAPQ